MLFVITVGCILVSVSTVGHHTGTVNMRGYDKTGAKAVFNVFL